MDLELHLLDVGHVEYGDATLCRADGRTVLVDGAHRGDEELIAGQLRRLLDAGDRVRVDLLVVTHAHQDHIGCLPELVEEGTLEAGWALVPKASLAWPSDPAEGVDEDRAAVIAGIREEDFAFLPDRDLAEALETARGVKPRFEGMVRRLRDAGTRVVEYDGTADSELDEAFEPLGLTVLGPSEKHLSLAAKRLGANVEALRAALEPGGGMVETQSVEDPVALYRALAGGDRVGSLLEGAPRSVVEAVKRSGAVVNAQSIVIALGPPGGRALLTGDMQFADPDAGADVDAEVEALWERVKKAGPYAFTKLSHHGSHNGSPADIAAALGCRTFGLCTGTNSGDHPSCEVIHALEAGGENSWVRTDRNGHSEVTVSAGGVKVDVARGRVSDPQCR